MIDPELEESIVSRLNLFEEIGVTEFTPLDSAVDDYIEFSRHPENRVWTGIPQIDAATRGLAPGELAIINGFAHNGKTVLVVEILLKNEGRPCILFTPDETRTAVLVKLSSAIHGISAEEFERRLNSNDPTAEAMLREVAERFKNLAVFDENVSLHSMDRAMDAFVAAVGRPAFVVFDYADLLSAELDTRGKLKALKAWGKEKQVPFYVLHQSSRSQGAGGQQVTITSGGYGGESEAFIMIGVRRKINLLNEQVRQLEERLEHPGLSDKAYSKLIERIHYIQDDQIPRHRDTITISLVKNKRPPMTLVSDIDFRLDKDTGRLLPLRFEGDDPDDEPPLPLEETYSSGGSARELLAKRKETS
jgi:KaiC/GvpD/RAD55 family RecA-like ATPase